MKSKLKKFFTAAVAVILFISSGFCYSQYTTIYREVATQNIAKGVTYNDIKMITSRGWIHYYVLKADLNNPDIKLKFLYNNKGISHLDNVKDMADQNSNIIGAVNSDFFNMNTIGDTIGAAVENNRVISTPNNTLPYATFYLTSEMKPYIEYLTNKVTLYAQNGKSQKLFGINKRYRGYRDIDMFTKEWGRKSPGAGVEMIVKNDVVEAINCNGSTGKYGNEKLGVNIPDENMTVFASAYYKNNFLMDNFKIGDTIKLNYDFGKNVQGDKLNLAVGGKNRILKDGKVTDQAWKSDGASQLNPGTVLAFDKHNNFYMLVVDGRQDSSTGMNMAEMATAIKQMGATDAISFDGGGSSTLITRMQGDKETSLVNSPSDGPMRKVADGIGFSITAKKGALSGIKLKAEDSYAFKNTRRFIDVIGYDANGNRVNVDSSKVAWSVSGVNGNIANKYFVPRGTGKAVIRAKIGNMSASTDIYCLDSPRELQLDTDYINPVKQSSHTFKVTGIDKDGFKASIDVRDIVWNMGNTKYGNVIGGTYKLGTNYDREGIKKGFSYIKASYGSVSAYCGVGNANITKVIDDFSNSKATFSKYPAEVTGSLQFTTAIAKDNKAAQLQYDFTKTDKTRAAYIDFGNKDIGNAYKIGFWVYGNGSGHMLRGIINDDKNKNATIDFAKGITWKGWKWVEADLSKLKLQAPMKLSKIYVVEPVPENKDNGSIYVDDVTISQYQKPGNGQIPASSTYYDYQMGMAPGFKKATDFSIAFVDSWKGAESKVYKLNNNASVLATDGLSDKGASVLVRTPVTINFGATRSSKVIKYKNASFYDLKADKYGISHYGAWQWKGLMSFLNSKDKSNAFIVMNSSIWGSSFNEQDRKFLLDKLSEFKIRTGRNVYLVELNAPKTLTYVSDGIRYINVNTNNFDNIPVVQVTSNSVKYRIIK